MRLKDSLKGKVDNFYKSSHDRIFKITESLKQQKLKAKQKQNSNLEQQQKEQQQQQQRNSFLYFNLDITSGTWKKNLLMEIEH